MEKVDLSKAEIGDIVHFRHGGRMRIGRIDVHSVESHDGINQAYYLGVGETPYTESIGAFSKDGINERYPHIGAQCEIIMLEKESQSEDTLLKEVAKSIKDRFDAIAAEVMTEDQSLDCATVAILTYKNYEPPPTQWAYDKACENLHKYKARCADLEAKLNGNG